MKDKKSFSFIDILKMIGDRVPTKEEKKILQEMLDEIKKKYLERPDRRRLYI